MIKACLVLHGNLQFSSIPKKEYFNVIRNSYWPFIKLVMTMPKIKIGVEFSGETLEIVNQLDPKLVTVIKSLISEGRLEFIGSSYTQAIFPLIPYDVNLKNLQLGMDVYKEILGQTPKIFYVNEQTFSDGIIGVYKEAGVKNIIIDFDSVAEEIRNNSALLYKPAHAVSQSKEIINIIWSSSIAFQKFQRYIFDEISFEDYWQYLSSHFSNRNTGSFCLYAGDWEVFGFSPKGFERNYKNDFKRIAELFGRLSEDKNIKFILPHQLIKNNRKPEITLTNFSDPILCKKQEKYNVTRWALAGKNTIFRNTQCFRLFKSIEELKKSKRVDNSTVEKLEKNLVKLWGSDYRTNTTDDKNREYDDLLAKTQKTIKKYASRLYGLQVIADTNFRNSYQTTTEESWATKSVKLTLDQRKGTSIKELLFPKIFPKKMAGLTAHGYFQNQQLSSDWFSGHCLFETDTGNKYTDLYPAQIFVKKNRHGNINLSSEIKMPIGTIRKSYKIYQDLPRVDLQYVFNFKKVGLKSARIGNVTLDPVNFDQSSLWYATVNGGKSKEVYKVGNSLLAQDEIVSFRISSKGCLGATNGWVAVGDNKKGILLTWDKAEIAGYPLVHFETTPQGLYGRIHYSIGESDETGYPEFNNNISLTISIIGFNKVDEIFNLKTNVSLSQD